MFGTLKPKRCGLSPTEREKHRALYCGLCQSLGEHHGQLTRPMVSFDAVFLAVIADGLSEAGAGPSQTRCPMVPVLHRATVDPDSAAMRFATHVSVLLADQLLADRAEEGRLAGWARPLVARPSAHARQALAALGVDLSGLQGFEQRQAMVERDPSVTVEAAAAPTAQALALVFASIAALPGVPHAAREDLQRLGEATGRIIYCIDALEDLRKDARKGAFNPCLDPATRQVDAQRRAACIALLEGALDEAGRALAALPWQRHRALAANIVSVEQRRRARKAIERSQTAPALAPPTWRALLTRPLLTVWLWWWTMSAAFARERKKGKGPFRRRKARTEPSEPEPAEPVEPEPAPRPEPRPPDPKPEPPEPEAPEPPELEVPEPPAEGCELPEPCVNCLGWYATEICECDECVRACLQPCEGCCQPCEGCNRGCGQCGEDCDACGRNCDKGCDGCEGCCNGCGDGCQQCCHCCP